MISITQAIRIGYRSCAVATAAGRVRQERMRKGIRRTEQRMEEATGAAKARTNQRLALWHNMFTAQNYVVKCFVYDTESLKGFKPRLEALWEHVGNNPADLPNWMRPTHHPLKGAVTFENFNTLSMNQLRTWEDEFTGNDDEIPSGDFNAEFEALFDLLVNDLWKVLGMSRWCDSELNRTPLDAETLALWDGIITDASNMIHTTAAKCHGKIANMLLVYQTDTPDETGCNEKYAQDAVRVYNCAQGLFAVDDSQLLPKYLNRMEADIVSCS